MKVFYPKNKDFVSYIPYQNQRVMVDIPSWRIVGDKNEVIRITFNGKIDKFDIDVLNLKELKIFEW